MPNIKPVSDAAEKILIQIVKTISEVKKFSHKGSSLSLITKIETDYRFSMSGNYLIF